MSIDESDELSLRHRYVPVDGLLIHVVDVGPDAAPNVLLLHGWPECWKVFRSAIHALSADSHVFAIDLPGIGDSLTAPPSYDKRTLAGVICRLLEVLDINEVTLVGQDIGGQIVYAALHHDRSRISRAVIASANIAGIDPWDAVLANPELWHFGFHSVPFLAEHLVPGHTAQYFDSFFDRFAATPSQIGVDIRRSCASAYAGPSALHTGFEWFRAFSQDAQDNHASKTHDVWTPVLYLRGHEDHGEQLLRYLDGMRSGGLRKVQGKEIHRSGHFIAIEQPGELARAVLEFMHSPSVRSTSSLLSLAAL